MCGANEDPMGLPWLTDMCCPCCFKIDSWINSKEYSYVLFFDGDRPDQKEIFLKFSHFYDLWHTTRVDFAYVNYKCG